MTPKITRLYKLGFAAAELGNFALADSIAIYVAALLRRYQLANKD